MRFPILLFDADDTLFDFHRACHYALDLVFPQYGIENTQESHQTYFRINQSVWDDFERGMISKEELQVERFRRLLAFLNLEQDPEKMGSDYVNALGQGSFLLDGALELCRDLRQRHRLYLVTNGIRQVQFSRISRSPLKEYVDGVFVSEDAGYPKPHIEYFRYVFSRIPDFDRRDTIIIGDSLTSDMMGGKNAGIATCWYNPAGKINNSGCCPDFEIYSLEEVRRIVE